MAITLIILAEYRKPKENAKIIHFGILYWGVSLLYFKLKGFYVKSKNHFIKVKSKYWTVHILLGLWMFNFLKEDKSIVFRNRYHKNNQVLYMYVSMMMCLICSIDIGFMTLAKLLYLLYACKKSFPAKILKKIEAFALFPLEVCA